MSNEEHNGPGFYYVVRWRRHDLAPSAKFEERPVDSKSNMVMIDGQSVYKPYEIYVLAVNDAGDAVSPPLMHIGYSSEDGSSVRCLSVCLSAYRQLSQSRLVQTSSRATAAVYLHVQSRLCSLSCLARSMTRSYLLPFDQFNCWFRHVNIC